MSVSAAAPDSLFEAFFDLSLTGAVLYEPVYSPSGEIIDFTFARLNPAAQRLLGLPAQPTATYLEQFPSAKELGAFAFRQQAFLGDGPAKWELSYPLDGQTHFYRLAARRVGGQLLTNFTDTSAEEYPVVDAALRASQAREQEARAEAERQRTNLVAAFEQAPVAFILFRGATMVVELANPEVGLILGRPVETILKQPFFEAIPDLQGQGLEELMASTFTHGTPHNLMEMPVRFERAYTGRVELGYFNITYRPRHDAQGTIVGVVCVAVEVTTQVLARQQVQNLNEELAAINEELRASNEEYLSANTALQEAQHQLWQLNQELEARVAERTQQLVAQQALQRQILHQAPAYVATFNGPTHVYSYFNPAFARDLTQGRAQLGRAFADLFPELVEQGMLAVLDGVYASGQKAVFPETAVVLRDPLTQQERTLYISVVYQPLHDEQGQVQGILAFAVDTTAAVLARQQVLALNEELAATNAELHEANHQLTRTNVDLDTFVYTASHDLKAPITNIEGLLAALQTHLPAEVQGQALIGKILGMMQGAAERFRLTITQLTDVSRLQHAQHLPAEQVALAAVVEDVCLDLLPQLTATQAQLEVAIDPQLTVLFAPKNLRSVVYNLLSNALKYHQPGQPPAVVLRATREGTNVVLTVQDNGLGLTPAQQQRLFGLFQRLHTHVEGSGVGLYMVKRMVENGGGTIAVQSQLGQGSTFLVTFRS